MEYIVARNANRRPTLMHRLASYDRTVCGVYIVGWSKHYFKKPILEILCVTCERNTPK